MGETNLPSNNEDQDDSQSGSSNQDAGNQTVNQPLRFSSRFGRRPEIRNHPYNHLDFVRLVDRQIRLTNRAQVSEASAAVSAMISSSNQSLDDLSEPSSGSPEPINDFQTLLESQVPRIGIFVVRITDLQSSLDALRAHDYEFIVINVAREVERNQIIPLCDLLLSSTGKFFPLFQQLFKFILFFLYLFHVPNICSTFSFSFSSFLSFLNL